MRKSIDKKVRAEKITQNWTSEILRILIRHFSIKSYGVCCYDASSYITINSCGLLASS